MPSVNVLVPVADVRRSCAFYCDVVGLRAESVDDKFAQVRAGDSMVWLHPVESVDLSGVELWLGVDDVDAVYERVAGAGVDDLRPPADAPHWGLRVASAPDPDGRRVYFCRPLDG